MIRKGLTQTARVSSQKWKAIASAVTVAIATVPAVHAIDISVGEWEGSFDTTLSLGASWRNEDQDKKLIGHWNQPAFDQNGDIILNGAFSNNSDDGNLNFHKGDSFSKVFKGTHDFGMQHSSGVGFFIRGTWFYDFELMDEDRRFRQLSDEAKDEQGKDARLLDAYIYHTFQFDENSLQVRLGEQVVNWGESTFIQHSISEANPVDLTKLRVPGAELKEAFIPVQSIWASLDLSDSLTLETYVQFEWEGVRVDEPGTYFSTTDFAGVTGDTVWLGFGITPEGAPGTAAARIADRPVRDDGQFGIKLGWYAEELGGTEFGFYYLNYHNKRPIISTNAHNGLQIEGFFEYLEDIKLYGVSFNTSTDGGLSIAGEMSYRQDEPLQIDDVELLFASLQSLNGAVVPDGTSQIPITPALGQEISGYRLFDTIQAQMTFVDFLGPGLGASQWTVLGEVGFNQIQDLPSQNDLRFEVAGTRRSGNSDRAAFEGVEENGFADAFSWGYRLVVKADYNDVYAGWNMSPRIVFQHDVSGNTPAPISNFIEGRKGLSFAASFDYLQEWKVDFAYNSYFGAGTQNLLSDRDFVSLNASYSF